jgi:hypothetical protein
MSAARVALPVAITILVCPALARAQEGAQRARLRWGAGGEVGWLASAKKGALSVGPLGGYGRLGVQFDDRFGLHLTAGVGTMLFYNHLRGALVADVTPVRWFSIGTGLAGWVASRLGFGGSGGGADAATFVGAPLVLGFYPGGGRLPNGARNGLGLTLTGVAGWTSDYDHNHRFGGGAALSVGYEVR